MQFSDGFLTFDVLWPALVVVVAGVLGSALVLVARRRARRLAKVRVRKS